jgi:hypothetical protein
MHVPHETRVVDSRGHATKVITKETVNERSCGIGKEIADS